MSHQDNPQDFIYTFSGKVIHPLRITPADIEIVDIAYALSAMFRFNSHTRVSVLRHSLAVAGFFEGKLKKVAVLHDAAEAYLMDVPKPLQCFVTTRWKEAYAQLEAMIFKKYNAEDYTVEDWNTIKEIDHHLVEYEMECNPTSPMRYPGPYKMDTSEVRRINLLYQWEKRDCELVGDFLDIIEPPIATDKIVNH